MKHWIAAHRALLGIAGLAATLALFGSLLWPTAPTALELAFLLVGLVGLGALVGSPYWKIVYREAPLRSAAGGPTDLDEREHGLRDRANSLAYFLFFTINLCLLAFALIMIRAGRLTLDGDLMGAIFFPYAIFGACLPVILLEWFEPSGGDAADAGAFDEEDAA